MVAMVDTKPAPLTAEEVAALHAQAATVGIDPLAFRLLAEVERLREALEQIADTASGTWARGEVAQMGPEAAYTFHRLEWRMGKLAAAAIGSDDD